MRILGIDPGLTHTGLCILDGTDITTSEIRLSDGADGWRSMARLIVSWIADHREFETGFDIIGLEDFVFRAPKASHGIVKHSAQMGKLVGFLIAVVEPEPILVLASDAQRNQPKGKAAIAAGIPGRNDHERCAYNVAAWLRGSMRLAGQR